jgi:hypothetical protein
MATASRRDRYASDALAVSSVLLTVSTAGAVRSPSASRRDGSAGAVNARV